MAKKNDTSKPEQPATTPKPKALPKLDIKAALEKAADDQSLSGFDLSALDFSGCDLRTVSFEGADLTGCLFKGAILQGCTFKGAKVDPDAFDEADTRWAEWQ